MGDYISREAVKTGMIRYGFTAPDMTVTEFVEDELPAADVEPAHRWIPCSERLPEVDDNYLCVYHFEAGNNYVSTLFFYATDQNPHFQCEGFQCEGLRGLKITHWMPHPEPPEDEP